MATLPGVLPEGNSAVRQRLDRRAGARMADEPAAGPVCGKKPMVRKQIPHTGKRILLSGRGGSPAGIAHWQEPGVRTPHGRASGTLAEFPTNVPIRGYIPHS